MKHVWFPVILSFVLTHSWESVYQWTLTQGKVVSVILLLATPVACPYGRSVRSFLRVRSYVFSVLFFVSSYSRRSVFVRLWSSVFSFFRWLVRPFVFFCSFVCCFHAWLYPPRMLLSEMLLWIMSPPCDENWWRKDWKQSDRICKFDTYSTVNKPTSQQLTMFHSKGKSTKTMLAPLFEPSRHQENTDQLFLTAAF